MMKKRKERQQGVDDEKKTGMKEREREKKRKTVPLPRTKEVDATEKSACFFGKKRTERTSIGGKKIFQAGDFTI